MIADIYARIFLTIENHFSVISIKLKPKWNVAYSGTVYFISSQGSLWSNADIFSENNVGIGLPHNYVH